MKRNLEMVRDILLIVEKTDRDYSKQHEVSNGLREAGYDNTLPLGHHLEIMNQAGLLECEITRYLGGGWGTSAIKLTWIGHEYLDAIRDEGIWSKVKEKVGNKIDSVTFDLIKILATESIKKSLE